MKKIVNNQGGYALVTVLFIITIFVILSLSFVTQAANNRKQNQTIEENYQAVALAEMGIKFYKQAIINELDEVADKAMDEIDAYKLEVENGTATRTPEEAIDDAIQQAISQLGSEFSHGDLNNIKGINHDIPIVSGSGASFIIQNVAFDPGVNNKERIISFSSEGFADGSGGVSNKAMVNAELKLDFSKMLLDEGTSEESEEEEDGGGFLVPNMPTGNEIEEPDGLNSCSNSLLENLLFLNLGCLINGTKEFTSNNIELANSVLKVVGGDLTFSGNMNKDISNSLLYVDGGFAATNFNGNNNVTLFVKEDAAISGNMNGNGSGFIFEILGNATFGGNLQLQDYSSLYVGKNATFSGNINTLKDTKINIQGNAVFQILKPENSHIYIGQNAVFNKNINTMVDSTIFVNSNATFSGIDMGLNSKICVNGLLNISGNININSSSSKIYAKTSTSSKVITGNAAFSKGGACYGSSYSGLPTSFGYPEISEKYTY